MTHPASSATEEVPIRDAATVVLLRDGTDGLEAWLLTRVTQMAFAAGMTVFPGGRVDDGDAALPFAGGDFDDLASRFDCTPEVARALVGAAVRETFEETGVLLTVPAGGTLDLVDARSDVEAGRISFGDLLREHGLAADAGAVRPWSRWVTPRGERRRYDTRFFIGVLPDGAQARDVTTESSAASWVPLGEALEQAQRGERMMLPPTITTLAMLVQYPTAAEAMAASAEQSLQPVRPTIHVGDDGAVSVDLPDGRRVAMPRGLVS